MVIHVVQRGDTVSSIARQYSVSVQRIINDNGLSSPQNLVVGQALLILQPQVVYTVQRGDTLLSIAAQYGVSVMNLLQNNPVLVTAPTLQVGQNLVIRFQGQKSREISVNAYAYPFIQRNILLRALPYLTYLTIFGYGFTEQGDLIGIDDQPLINLAYQFQAGPVMLLSSITEDGNFDSKRASMLFQNPVLQNKVLDNIVKVMQQKGYVGLDIDFEFIEPDDAAGFLAFIENAVSRLRPLGYFVNTDLAPKTSAAQKGLLYESHNYAAIGAASDTVLLMTYEWGYIYGPPMAVAPVNRVREVVSYAVSEIDPNKIMLGIPNYAYNWPLPFVRGTTQATTIGNQQAVQIAGQNRVEIQFDLVAKSPYFEYYDRNNVKHVVWFEDVRSIQAKLDLMDEFSLRGAGYWNAMRPFNQNWGYLSARYNIRKLVP